jgi:hypothetical protein
MLGRDTSRWVGMMSCWVDGTRIFTFGFTNFEIRRVLLSREYEQVNLIGSILITNHFLLELFPQIKGGGVPYISDVNFDVLIFIA